MCLLFDAGGSIIQMGNYAERHYYWRNTYEEMGCVGSDGRDGAVRRMRYGRNGSDHKKCGRDPERECGDLERQGSDPGRDGAVQQWQ